MPYNLRPEAVLKRPTRYDNLPADGSDDTLVSPLPDTATPIYTAQLARDQFSPTSLSCISSALPESNPSSTRTLILKLPLPPSMQNIQNIRKTPQRSEGDRNGDRRDSQHDASSSRAPKLRPTQGTPVPDPINKRSAAFPTLPRGASQSKGNTPGVTDLMLAKERGPPSDCDKCQQNVDEMYALVNFPTPTEGRQKDWYYRVSANFVPDPQEAEITFASLYPSLRQVIHESIKDAFSEGTYPETFHPVRSVLRLTRNQLTAILKENSSDWDEIPPHLLELKRLYPDKPIDPETPPIEGVVRAIRFLKQEHLPGSLLGEWQFPVPSRRAFLRFRKPNPSAPTPPPPPNGPTLLLTPGTTLRIGLGRVPATTPTALRPQGGINALPVRSTLVSAGTSYEHAGELEETRRRVEEMRAGPCEGSGMEGVVLGGGEDDMEVEYEGDGRRGGAAKGEGHKRVDSGVYGL